MDLAESPLLIDLSQAYLDHGETGTAVFEAAYEAFARSRPDSLILLIDTYDTETAAWMVVSLAPRLEAEGIRIRGVRLDRRLVRQARP